VKLSPQFIEALDAQRESLNERVRIRTKLGAKIDADEFKDHLAQRIGPIIDAVHAYSPERIRRTVADLVEVSLDLFTSNHLGGDFTTKHMHELWENLLPQAAPLIASNALRCVGSLTNGLVHVESHDEQAAGRWLELLQRSLRECQHVDEWLITGKIAAWLSGMAQYRREAIALAGSLRPAILRSLFDLPDSMSDADVGTAIANFSTNPWSRFATDAPLEPPTIERVKVCCKFRGFGGTLMAPPHVASMNGKILVTDGTHVWHLMADRFGWTTHRHELDPEAVQPVVSRQPQQPLPRNTPKLQADGTVVWGDCSETFSEVANCSSEAFDGLTLAVTIPSSFHVFLFYCDAASSRQDSHSH
jgi:hypothetical protein